MGDRRLLPARRNKRIRFEVRRGEKDGFGHRTVNAEWREKAHRSANVMYGAGSEQRAAAQPREAAQQVGSQTASFYVLADSDTRAVSISDRIRYPLSDPDPAKWPAWEISAIEEIGFNEGFGFTATRVAT